MPFILASMVNKEIANQPTKPLNIEILLQRKRSEKGWAQNLSFNPFQWCSDASKLTLRYVKYSFALFYKDQIA